MGVKGLWKLVAPAGHQINIETLHGRILAVDVSIWIVQFLKAMRGNDGQPVKNCHLLGTLKRVARLLYHNIRPVFVFDGAAPALKLQTIQARQQRKRDADFNVEQAARRILVARMHRLISSSSPNTTTNAAQQQQVKRDGGNEGKREEKEHDYENNAATTMDCKNDYEKTPSASHVIAAQHTNGVVLLENFEGNDGSHVVDPSSSMAGSSSSRTIEQHDNGDEEIQWQPGDTNEMEEGEEESTMMEDDDILLPEGDRVDISVIAALPVHLRKKVIEKAQRNERMRSRRVYMPLAANPQRFCHAQIQNIIRGSDLNRQIRNLQGITDQKTVLDVNSKERSIASDETRKFIVTTSAVAEPSNVEGSSTTNQVPTVDEDRLGTYKGFEQWVYQSSDDEEEDITKNGPEDRSSTGKQESSSSTMKIERKEKKSTTTTSPYFNNRQENINNKERTRGCDGGGFLLNIMSDDNAAATLDGTTIVERSGEKTSAVVLDEYKQYIPRRTINDGLCGFIEPQVLVAAAAKNHHIEKGSSSSSSCSIYEMGSSEEDGRGMNVVTKVHNSPEHGDDVVVVQQQWHSSSSNSPNAIIIPPAINANDEMKNEERQPQGRQKNHPSQCGNDALGVELQHDILNHAEVVAGSSNSATTMTNTTIGFSSTRSNTLQQEEDEEGHRVRVTSTATLEQQLQADDENNSPNVGAVTANCNQIGEEEIEIHDIEIEVNHETTSNFLGCCSSLDGLVDAQFQEQQPILGLTADEGGGYDEEVVDKIIQKSSEILGNMPDYIKHRFQRHVKEYRDKVLAPPPQPLPPVPLSMDEKQRHDENLDKIHHAHGSFSGDGEDDGRLINLDNADDEWEDGMMKTEDDDAQQQQQQERQHQSKTRDSEVEEELSSHHLEVESFENKLNSDGSVGNVFVSTTTKCEEEEDQKQMELSGKHSLESRTPQEQLIQEDEEEEQDSTSKAAHNKAMRDAATVTDEMKEDVMGLLELLGIPYMVAPMEAEAQCAELERLNLVEGTITDDSDAFIFGSRNVYKNIFQDGKNIEAYNLSDITREVGIGRKEMQCLAMLLGSDYTEGINGVGPVNAMEIVEAFSVKERGVMQGLTDFRDWLEAAVDPIDEKRLARLSANGNVTTLSSVERFSIKHRNARLRWTVKSTFPEKDIIKAYQHPRVNSNMKKFTWHFPDETGLHTFCSQFLGWDHQESTKLLDPIMKKLKERGGMRQRRLDDYFVSYGDNERFARFRSKRLRSAVKGVVGKGDVSKFREPDPAVV